MRRVISAAVGTIAGLIMLLTFKVQTVTTLAPPPSAISQASAAPAPTTVTTGAAGAPPSTTTTAAAVATTRIVTGNAAQTRYGPVQVEITVTNGQITAATAVVYPTQSGRDRQINARAVPQLSQEALTAQSARIDTVSGATYTSNGYRTSLQSAIDQAGLA